MISPSCWKSPARSREGRWVSRLSDRTVMKALAETVVLLAETPRKELMLAPSEADMAKIREQEPS